MSIIFTFYTCILLLFNFFIQTTRSQQDGDQLPLTCTVRDIGYLTEGPQHPDFGTFRQEDKTIVGGLGSDNKPIYNGNPTTPTTTGFANFQLWYNTDHRVTGDGSCGQNEICPRNLESKHDIILTYNAQTNLWGFDSGNNGFFILDKKGFQPTTTPYPQCINDTVDMWKVYKGFFTSYREQGIVIAGK